MPLLTIRSFLVAIRVPLLLFAPLEASFLEPFMAVLEFSFDRIADKPPCSVLLARSFTD